MIRISKSYWTLALLLSAVVLERPARGDLFHVNLTGSVDLVDPSLTGTFALGQTMNGSYVFDSATAPRAGSNATFAVYDALKTLTFSVGGYAASSNGAPEIQVDNNPPLPNHDRYGVVSRASEGLTGASVGGNALTAFGFRLDDSTDTVFSTALVLPTSLNLANFDNARFFVFFGDIGNPKLVSGTIGGLTVSAIPEPGVLSLGLLGLALAGFTKAVGRARRSRNPSR
ncbi:MAG: PEP-CTERM sorting domain-containing protein [Isosphaeraceae bacterium]